VVRKRLPSVSENFTGDRLWRVRDLVEGAARVAGVSASRVHDLVIAVNEIAANAVRYGGGAGRITVEETTDGVQIEVSDNGPGLPGYLPYELPAPDKVSGRGLWIVRQLCRHLDISSTARGVTVRLFMPRVEWVG
jgi:serine/threonine-protein kinase RsbW